MPYNHEQHADCESDCPEYQEPMSHFRREEPGRTKNAFDEQIDREAFIDKYRGRVSIWIQTSTLNVAVDIASAIHVLLQEVDEVEEGETSKDDAGAALLQLFKMCRLESASAKRAK